MMWKELIAYKTPVRGLAFKEFLEIDKGMALILCLYIRYIIQGIQVFKGFSCPSCVEI